MHDSRSAGSDSADSDAVEALLIEALEALDNGGAAAVERLLAAHPAAASQVRTHLERLHRHGLAGTARADAPAEHPERLGDFRIVAPIGHGGMGVVYRAVQESLGREVALKLIRPDQLFFPGARERFRREVELVARMQHPGIVPIHAVGTDAGVPYFAMELVRGVTLAEVVDALDGSDPATLTGADLDATLAARSGDELVRAPTELFRGSWTETVLRIVRDVAEALEHAHRRGVLHRDVKPSNVMLTRDGRVLLLDFGLAGAAGSERMTRTGSAIGSLAYMAPEVLAGVPNAHDARSDVYSLGATCWELLALMLPYQSSDPVKLRELTAAAARPKLTTRNAAVSWEIETVLATAMEPEPARRYASAQAFARDLDNVLARRPIDAREASAGLRARRWMQRHPARATAIAAIAFVLIGGPSLWAWQEGRARERIEAQRDQLVQTNAALDTAKARAEAETARAQGNFDKLLEAVDTMLTKVGDQNLRDIPRMEVVRRDLLGTALRFYEGFLAQQPDDPRLRTEAATVRIRMAEVHGLLGDYTASAKELEAALAILQAAAKNDAAIAKQVARSRGRLATARRLCGDLPGALAATQEAITAWQGLASDDSAPVARGLGEARMEASLLAADRGDLPGALSELETSLAEITAWRSRHDDDDLDHLEARTLDRAAVWMYQLARQSRTRAEAMPKIERALAHHQRARELWVRMAKLPDVQMRADSAQNLVNMSLVLQVMRRSDEAKQFLEEAVQRLEALVADFPASRRRRSELGSARNNLSALYGTLGDVRAASEQAAAAIPTWQTLVDDDAANDEYATGLAHALQTRAVCLYEEKAPAEGLPLLQRAGAAIDTALAVRPENPTYRVMRRKVAETLATVCIELGRADEAVAAARELLDPRLTPNEPVLCAGLVARAALVAGVAPQQAGEWRAFATQLVTDELQRGGKPDEWRRDPRLADQWDKPGLPEVVAEVEAARR